VDDDHVRVLGEVIDFDENDVLTLRTGGTFLLIDTEGIAPVCVTGTTVSVAVDDLEIFPINM
jgi:hypothetical protein